MNEWQEIETCPLHEDVLFFIDDDGILFGQKTYIAEWLSEDEQANLSEADLWTVDCWSFSEHGLTRLELDLHPTHWMSLPKPPQILTQPL